MRTVRPVIRKFFLPVAIFAGVAWAVIFAFSFTAMPRQGVGIVVLFALAGIVMLGPWVVMALGVMQRMRENAGSAKDDTGDDPENR